LPKFLIDVSIENETCAFITGGCYEQVAQHHQPDHHRFGIFVTFYSYYYLKLGILITPGAGYMPFLCGIALIILGIVWRIQTMIFKSPSPVKHAGEPSETACEVKAALVPGSWVKLCWAFVATVVYAFLFERIGYLLSTLVFMLGGRRSWSGSVG